MKCPLRCKRVRLPHAIDNFECLVTFCGVADFDYLLVFSLLKVKYISVRPCRFLVEGTMYKSLGIMLPVLCWFFSAAYSADPPINVVRANNDVECSGRMLMDPDRKDHVRQEYVRCSATGPAIDLDFHVCRLDGNVEICTHDGKGNFFYVWNTARDLSGRLFKVSAQNSEVGPSDSLYTLNYRILFQPDPCNSGSIPDQLRCLTTAIHQVGDKVDKFPDYLADLRSSMAGFGCSDKEWCLVIAPNGDAYMGNPSFVVANYPKLVPAKNVLRDQKDKSPRSFELICGVLVNWGRYCSGVDDKGNVYSGLIEPEVAGDARFFDFRSGVPAP